MDKRLGANARSNPVAGCDWFCDNLPLVALWAKWGAGIHKDLSPFGLRIFLAQRRIFFCRRIYSIRLPPSLGQLPPSLRSYEGQDGGHAVQKFFLSFQKSSVRLGACRT
ncbi:MAG: hypothetical protein NT118_00950 [Lentisphaerae bacterium]|nr:hypothetical protein [Lentisphaerota bacterium]